MLVPKSLIGRREFLIGVVFMSCMTLSSCAHEISDAGCTELTFSEIGKISINTARIEREGHGTWHGANPPIRSILLRVPVPNDAIYDDVAVILIYLNTLQSSVPHCWAHPAENVDIISGDISCAVRLSNPKVQLIVRFDDKEFDGNFASFEDRTIRIASEINANVLGVCLSDT